MSSQDLLTELDLLVRSRYGLIILETPEEERAEAILRELSLRLSTPLHIWTAPRGLRRVAPPGPAIAGTEDVGKALEQIDLPTAEGLYFFRGLDQWLGDPLVRERLKDAIRHFTRSLGAIVLAGDGLVLPPELQGEGARVKVPVPQEAEYRELLRRVVRDLSPRMDLVPDEVDRMLAALRGLTLSEAQRILTRVVLDDGRLDASDIDDVVAAKREAVRSGDLLEYCTGDAGLDEVAGLDALKSWLQKRRALIADPKRAERYGLPFPKGILLLGVPGCGKSLCAKAVAREWELPLLRLDPGRLYNKFVGETERNLRRAIASAEHAAPVVLWVDEIEKAFSTDSGAEDGGLSTRVLGSFLSWLQDREQQVFLVATANEVQRLPPELIRKGRFDEVFFVDLPGPEQRRAIFEIHLRRRKVTLPATDVADLAERTEGFSGAEIEQVIVAGQYTAFAADGALSTVILQTEIGATRPLSATMDSRFAELRQWAKGRAVMAG
ncbi:MAG: AAA family ATPase [Gemmatimonadota bacterium]